MCSITAFSCNQYNHVSPQVFTLVKIWCYRITSIILALPCAVCWGLHFACLAFCQIWCCIPCLKVCIAVDLSISLASHYCMYLMKNYQMICMLHNSLELCCVVMAARISLPWTIYIESIVNTLLASGFPQN